MSVLHDKDVSGTKVYVVALNLSGNISFTTYTYLFFSVSTTSTSPSFDPIDTLLRLTIPTRLGLPVDTYPTHFPDPVTDDNGSRRL